MIQHLVVMEPKTWATCLKSNDVNDRCVLVYCPTKTVMAMVEPVFAD